MKAFSRTLALLTASLISLATMAQVNNQQPIKVLLPFPPGGGSDSLTRMVTTPLASVIGQPIVMDYKPGGNSIIGAQTVATAKPDGMTYMVTMDMTATILPAVYSRLPFDPIKDLEPVAVLTHVPALFVAHPKVPANNLQELVAYSKKNPDKLNYGAAVLYGQVLGQQLKTVSGLTYTYVPYKGAAEAVQAVVAGHLDFMMLDIQTGLGFIKDGRLKALAITSAARHSTLPDVPTVGEMGWPDLQMSVWYGMFAPAGTPSAIVDKMNTSVIKVTSDPALRKRLAELGHEVSSATPAQVKALIEKDAAKWRQAARDGNIKLD